MLYPPRQRLYFVPLFCRAIYGWVHGIGEHFDSGSSGAEGGGLETPITRVLLLSLGTCRNRYVTIDSTYHSL